MLLSSEFNALIHTAPKRPYPIEFFMDLPYQINIYRHKSVRRH